METGGAANSILNMCLFIVWALPDGGAFLSSLNLLILTMGKEKKEMDDFFRAQKKLLLEILRDLKKLHALEELEATAPEFLNFAPPERAGYKKGILHSNIEKLHLLRQEINRGLGPAKRKSP